ncbi:2-amino-4-hydroxy-6-hydroxymethyldihydropteridine diphosphokinase [Thioalkalivibrio sp.]|uniref:2-amino-4-hydroxy-6- hydroxymethyldihydropteridine diphosphokinase n=1 Tax=Thioalkalivibrio sp. TaxID=2093813 RepID=UPI003568F10A
MSAGDRGVQAFIGIGANLGDPEAQVRESFARLAKGLPKTRLTGRSRMFRNPPMGPQDQPDYVNAVARLYTRLEPLELLVELQGIECACGRERDGTRWGPRRLDLDLLLFGDQSLDLPGLQVPHAGIADRDFVILPLLELAPGLQIPGMGPLELLAQRFEGANLIPVAEPEASVTAAEGHG